MAEDSEKRFRPEDAAAEEQRAEYRKPDAAPYRAADAFAVVRAFVLGDEGPGIEDGADEDAGDGEVGEAAREGGGDGLPRMAREHQAVDEHVDRVTRVGKDERQRDPEHLPDAPGHRPRLIPPESHRKKLYETSQICYTLGILY